MSLTKNEFLLLNSFSKRKKTSHQSKQMLNFSHPTNIIIIQIQLHTIIVPGYKDLFINSLIKTRQKKKKITKGMLAFIPLFVTATALLAAYTSAAPLSHSPANPTKGVTPTLFRLTDPTTTYRVPAAVAKDRASNPEERDLDPNTDGFPTVVAKGRAPHPGEKEIDPTTTHRIPTAVAKDHAPNPGEKEHINQSLSDVSPAPANIQYHSAVKREIRGPFLHAPLIPSSFDIGADRWHKKTQKHNGQFKPDNSLNRQVMEGGKRIEGE